jgi:hypothetical protein
MVTDCVYDVVNGGMEGGRSKSVKLVGKSFSAYESVMELDDFGSR